MSFKGALEKYGIGIIIVTIAISSTSLSLLSIALVYERFFK